MICFYHNDADGQMSAMWIMAYAYKDAFVPRYIPMQYGDEFPLDKINENEYVYIVDYSLDIEVMNTLLLSKTKNVVWIDHHKTAIEKYENYPFYIKGLRYDGIAACELTYAYLMKMTEYLGTGALLADFDPEMVEDCPMHTRYIGDRDVWKYQFGDLTRLFYDGYQLLNHDINNLYHTFLLMYNAENVVDLLIDNGVIIGQYKKNMRTKSIANYAYTAIFEDQLCLVCNCQDRTSELFGEYFKKYPLCIAYVQVANGYSVSLYSAYLDVSELAKKHGGGGHKGAAGFVSQKSLDELFTDRTPFTETTKVMEE